MKGPQKLTMTVDGIMEAMQEYLQKRMTEIVQVTGVEAVSDTTTRGYGAGPLSLVVTFTSEPKALSD